MVFWATWWGPHSNSRWFCHLFVKLRDVWWDSQFFFPIHVFFWWQTHVYHFHKCISGLVEIDLSPVGGLEFFNFFHIFGMSSSQQIFIFFRGVAQPPTSIFLYTQNVRNPPGIAGPNSPSLPGENPKMWGGEAIIWAPYPQWGWFHLENSHKDHPSCRNLLFLYVFIACLSWCFTI